VTASNGLFALIVVAAAGFFGYNVQRLVAYLRIGRLDDSRWDHVPRRLFNLITVGLFQRKIFRDSVAGPMHAAIFWGFCVLTVGTTEFIGRGIMPGFTFAHFMPLWVYRFYQNSQDLWGALVIGAVAFALWRRLTHRVPRLQGAETHANDPLLILSWIGALMVTMFLAESFEMIAFPESASAYYRPLSFLLAQLFSFVPHDAAAVIRSASWWSHGLLVLGFLNYLPYSKHLHVVASLPNVYLSNTSGPGQAGVMKYMDLEADVEQFGAKDVEHLSWKSLMDGFACTECGRCTAVCPANITGKLLSPRKIVVNVRERLEIRAPAMLKDDGRRTMDEDKPLLDGFISEQELWACTTCRACVQECPVSIDQLSVILEMRRNLVLGESRFPEEVMPAFESMEQRG